MELVCKWTSTSKIHDHASEKTEEINEEKKTTYLRDIDVLGDCSCSIEGKNVKFDKISLDIESSLPLGGIDFKKRMEEIRRTMLAERPTSFTLGINPFFRFL